MHRMRSMQCVAVYMVVAFLGTVTARKSHLNFDKCNEAFTHTFTDHNTYEVTWNGRKLSSSRCQFKFHGYDNNSPRNDYKICIKATGWNIRNTQVMLKYYTGLTFSLKKTFSYYSAHDNPTRQWCSDADPYVYVELDTQSTTEDQGSLTLEVSAEMTHNHYVKVVAWSVGAVGCIVFFSVCIIIVAGTTCRKKRREVIIYDPPCSSSSFIPQSGYQQTGGYNNPGRVVGTAPQPYDTGSSKSNPSMIPQGYQNQTYQQYTDPDATRQMTF